MARAFANRLNDIEPFRVVEILTRARQLESEGKKIIHLEVGEPDFTTAEQIISAGQASLGRGETFYSPAAGILPLRKAISRFYQQQYSVDVDPARIMITPGASGALLLMAALLVNPGDGMLMTDPGYPCNRHFLRVVEGCAQLVPVGLEDNFQLTVARAEEHWQSNTIGAMVASPANPTGEILSRQALRGLFELCQRKNGYLVVDEIYHGLDYGDETASVLEITDQAFVINSFSKYFGMTGWRLGWLVAPEHAIPSLEKLAQNLFISMSTMSQYAALAAFDPDTLAVLELRKQEFARRRDYLLPALRKLGFEIPHTPAGALYLYAGIEKFSDNSAEFCLTMLEEHGIAITPGSDFGSYKADTHVRFAYTTGMDQLQEAVARMEKIFA